MSLLGFAGCWGDGPNGLGGGPAPELQKPQLVRSWGGRGVANGQFQTPHGIAISPRGPVYIADFQNHRIQKFSAGGDFLATWELKGLAGDPPTPHDIAIDSRGLLYVADIYNDRILVLDSEGRLLTSWGKRGTNAGELFLPAGVAISGSHIFVVDVAQRVQRFDLNGVFETGWSLYDGSVEEFPDVFGLDVDPQGCVWVVERAKARLRRFDPDGKLLESLANRGGTPGSFQNPISIAVDRLGRILVGDASGRLQLFDSTGRFLVDWPLAETCDMTFDLTPISIAISNAERIFVVNVSSARVLEFAIPAGPVARRSWAWGTYGTKGGTFTLPGGIDVDSGLVYVSDQTGRVQVFTASGDFLHELGSMGTGDGEFESPHGIATFGDRIYITDTRKSCVDVFEQSGKFVTAWPLEADASTRPADPRGIATDHLGNVHVCATRSRIDVFRPDGARLRSWGDADSSANRLQDAADIAVTSEGEALVADAVCHCVKRFDAYGTFISDFALLPSSEYAGLDIGPGGQLFVSLGSRVFEYDAGGTLLASWGRPGNCVGEFQGTGDVSVDDFGRVFITDVGNHRVQVFTPPYP